MHVLGICRALLSVHALNNFLNINIATMQIYVQGVIGIFLILESTLNVLELKK